MVMEPYGSVVPSIFGQLESLVKCRFDDHLIAGSVLTDYGGGGLKLFMIPRSTLAEKQMSYWAGKTKRRRFPL